MEYEFKALMLAFIHHTRMQGTEGSINRTSNGLLLLMTALLSGHQKWKK
jgi:hypothetical protein